MKTNSKSSNEQIYKQINQCSKSKQGHLFRLWIYLFIIVCDLGFEIWYLLQRSQELKHEENDTAWRQGPPWNKYCPPIRQKFDLTICDIDTWDITDRASGENHIEKYRPDVLINLAAITDVDGCEDKRELAERVNAYGAGIVADLCREHNIRFVHISTDYVFDGKKTLPYKENDPTKSDVGIRDYKTHG